MSNPSLWCNWHCEDDVVDAVTQVRTEHDLWLDAKGVRHLPPEEIIVRDIEGGPLRPPPDPLPPRRASNILVFDTVELRNDYLRMGEELRNEIKRCSDAGAVITAYPVVALPRVSSTPPSADVSNLGIEPGRI